MTWVEKREVKEYALIAPADKLPPKKEKTPPKPKTPPGKSKLQEGPK